MPSPAVSTALAAFLRGTEPRALVLARAHGGPALIARALLDEVRRAFLGKAASLAIADWPRSYWILLLGRPELADPDQDLPDHPLYELASTRRIALLLRLVLGLEPAGAARVLELSEPAYRALLADAEDQLARLGIGPVVLSRWQEGFLEQTRVQAERWETPPELAPTDSVPTPAPARPSLRWRPVFWALLGLAALLVLALLARLLWLPAERSAEPPTAEAATAPSPTVLPLPRSPGSGASAEALPLDPDFALLAVDPNAPWREVAKLSWWSAVRGDPLPEPPPASSEPVPSWPALTIEERSLLAAVAAHWQALDDSSRRALLGRVQLWLAADPARRQAWHAAHAQWLQRPAVERAQLRARFSEWQALPDSEQQLLRRLTLDFGALPPQTQQALQADFAVLSAQQQADWALGPRLGRQLPRLRPLLAFVPAAEQEGLFDALNRLDDAEREALASRVAAMGEAERRALRTRVLATDPRQRVLLLLQVARG